MISSQTIKRVIGICEGFDPVETAVGDLLCVVVTLPGNDGKFDVNIEDFKGLWLDALAAEAVRVIDESGRAGVYPVQGMTEIQWEYETSDQLDSITVRGPDRTANTLNAIAEFIEKHPEVFAE